MSLAGDTPAKELPTKETMVSLYCRSMVIQLLAGKFLHRIETLRRLAINSEVLASRSRTNGRAISAIAKELQTITQKMTAILDRLVSDSSQLATYALVSTAKARQCEKYQMVLQTGISGKNRALIESTRNRMGCVLISELEKLRRQLEMTQGTMLDLTRVSIHIPMVATFFKIEAASCQAQMETTFRNIADQLVTLNDRLALEIEDVVVKVKGALAIFDSTQGTVEEESLSA